MAIDTQIFIGVDLSGGRKPFTYAAIDHNGKLVVLNSGEMDDVLLFLSGQVSALLAINGAARPNLGLVRQTVIRQNLPPLHTSGRSLDMRLAEHILRQHDINISMTPGRKELCSSWVQTGFDFYHQISDLGYLPHPTLDARQQWLETHPHACFCGLLGQSPLAGISLEGRLQRQLALFETGLEIRDPMDFFEELTRHKLLRGLLPLDQIYAIEELNAIAAAYVAYTAGRHPERILKIGDAEEGQITMPIAQLKEKY